MAVLSTVKDHICMKNKNNMVRLSSHEVSDCDVAVIVFQAVISTWFSKSEETKDLS